MPLPSPIPGREPIPISPFRRQEGSDTDSTNPVDGKRRKVTRISPIEKAFQNNARHELDSIIAGCFTSVDFHLTLQGTHIIVIPMHMLLLIAFQVMFPLDTML